VIQAHVVEDIDDGGAEVFVVMIALVRARRSCVASMENVRRYQYAECVQNVCHVLTTMGHAVGITGRLKPSPFLLENMATPHVPRGVVKRLPINASFLVNIKRSDPIH
jgi:hypothetical protein